MGHATACWMTCGSVKGIEVYGNEVRRELLLLFFCFCSPLYAPKLTLIILIGRCYQVRGGLAMVYHPGWLRWWVILGCILHRVEWQPMGEFGSGHHLLCWHVGINVLLAQ